MKNNFFILFFAITVLLLSACETINLNHSSGRYYAPTIFVNGQEEETMLTTDFASLDIVPQSDGTVNISLQYRGPDYLTNYGIYYISAFHVTFSGISCEKNEPCAILNGEDQEAELFYDYVVDYENKGHSSIVRKFNINGSLCKTERNISNITLSSVIFDKTISITLAGMTPVESEAEFGIEGYPSWDAELVYRRYFVNNTNHSVEVRHSGNIGGPLALAAGEKGYILLSYEGGYYSLTFDDGRSSVHMPEEARFHYTGLPVEVKEQPYLFFNYGGIFYNIRYNCTYAITQEVYDAAE